MLRGTTHRRCIVYATRATRGAWASAVFVRLPTPAGRLVIVDFKRQLQSRPGQSV